VLDLTGEGNNGVFLFEVYMTTHSVVIKTGVISAFTVARGQAFKYAPPCDCEFCTFSSSRIISHDQVILCQQMAICDSPSDYLLN